MQWRSRSATAAPDSAPQDYAVAFERGVLNQKYRGRRPVGSGIGLALAHGLITSLGGTLTAAPAPEGGAAFTIHLPTSPNPKPPTKANPPRLPPCEPDPHDLAVGMVIRCTKSALVSAEAGVSYLTMIVFESVSVMVPSASEIR